ncbi:multicopper oxidase-domain-containing protein [Tricharina praecox]|uniref:multicopper oxidase-domain-containing protein n=1 Tax=Tricharina praecox TaxID=43433 RepID=UPI0022200E1C|nr:multicopper oxidase-domain-containing protein [Tricharina praecox]KAI5846077.1 multicopper oxidase-domain-containing protein [Tricharina praecox]
MAPDGVTRIGNEADGVNGVTQCPIKPGDSYTYEWQATQYGHSWYHSHYSLQYPDGVWDEVLRRPLLIHGPTSANWDIDVGVITISDYFHESAFLLFSVRHVPSPWYPHTHLFKYLLRIVNTSTATQFRLAIDNHMLQVVQADFVPIEPYLTEYISAGIGQRYTIVVTANPNSTDPFPIAPSNNNFWIRTVPLKGCGQIAPDIFPTYGILRYNSRSTSNPTSKPWQGGILSECPDEPAENMHPIVPWTVGGKPLWLDWGNPAIINLDNRTWNPEYDVIVEDHDSWQWVYFIIQGIFPRSGHITVAHPIHLHGHDFAILAQGKGEWDTIDPRPTLNLNNPVRRDVALLDADGYLGIAFRTDNPGVWLMHCHIAWHASSGLALQLLERQGEIRKTIRNPQQLEDTCMTWRDYRTNVTIFQDGSGV